MSGISLFYGIRITIDYEKDRLPQFRAAYVNHSCVVDISDCVVIQGYLPRKQMSLVIAWALLHRDELMQDWELARDGNPPDPIPPLA